jgi:hypothetical protein
MIGLKIKVDTRALKTVLNRIETRTVPYATSVAINDVAFQVQAGERDNIQKTFKHPRPFTVRSVLTNKSTWQTQRALVYIRQEVGKYLAPYEFGGVHVLPGAGLLNPKLIRLDQYGQLTKGTPARLRARKDVFVATIGGVTGFYQRLANHKIKLLIAFGNALTVKEHLDYVKRGRAIVKQTFPAAFDKAFAQAMSTLRIPKSP